MTRTVVSKGNCGGRKSIQKERDQKEETSQGPAVRSLARFKTA